MKDIEKLEDDIKSITIQGATNVALATLKGISIVAQSADDRGTSLIKKVQEVGKRLAYVRENEPLAKNAVAFIHGHLRHLIETGSREAKDVVLMACDEYRALIAEAKERMVTYGTEVLQKEEVILTHCHSSTTVSTLYNIAQFQKMQGEKLRVIATETRPRYQGRKTAQELYEKGVDVTLIVDSACTALIIDDRYEPVGAVVVGCDELLRDGSFINKVGTYALAIAAQQGGDEFYVATTLLKLDLERNPRVPQVEQRGAKEVWREAPEGLKIINPAFDIVKSIYVTGYITEAGVLKADELVQAAKEVYPWIAR